MPVTTYRIPMTMGERGAVRAVQALKPTTVIPIHLAVAPRSPLLRTNHTPEGFTRLGRPQVAIINLDEYRRIQRFRQEREAFFERLETTAARNAERNAGLSDEEVLAIIEQACAEVASAGD